MKLEEWIIHLESGFEDYPLESKSPDEVTRQDIKDLISYLVELYQCRTKGKIKFRWHRGGLAESMQTAMAFDDVMEMIKYISDGIDPLYTAVCIKPYDDNPDGRIGWKRTNMIKAAKYDPLFNIVHESTPWAFCDAVVNETKWYWICRGWNEIKEIHPQEGRKNEK